MFFNNPNKNYPDRFNGECTSTSLQYPDCIILLDRESDTRLIAPPPPPVFLSLLKTPFSPFTSLYRHFPLTYSSLLYSLLSHLPSSYLAYTTLTSLRPFSPLSLHLTYCLSTSRLLTLSPCSFLTLPSLHLSVISSVRF